MTPCFKKYLKDAAKGAVAGATFGAACGSAAGSAGLDQVCWSSQNTISCFNGISALKSKSAGAGAGAGAAVGLLIGALVYPAYEGFMGWLKLKVETPVDFKNVVSNNQLEVITVEEVSKKECPVV